MVDFKTLRAQSDNRNGVRKALGVVGFLAPTSADPIQALTGTDGTLNEIPADYLPIGLFSEDGLEFSLEKDQEEVLALGYRSYVRRDTTSETHGVTLNALEIDRKVIAEIRYGIDLTGVVPDVNGEIKYSVGDETFDKEWRLLLIAQDKNKSTGADIYRAKMYHNVQVSSWPTEAWGTDPMSAEFEFTAKSDETTEQVFDEFLAGPGLTPELIADMGYSA